MDEDDTARVLREVAVATKATRVLLVAADANAIAAAEAVTINSAAVRVNIQSAHNLSHQDDVDVVDLRR